VYMKKNKDLNNTDKFFQKLAASEDLKKERELIGLFFKKPIWWLLKSIKKSPPKFKATALVRCDSCRKSTRRRGECLRRLLRFIRKAGRTRRTQQFTCPGNLGCFCLPVAQGDRIYGYIGLCHLDTKMPAGVLALFENFMTTLIKAIQRELELSTLYETIRPRAIALSTVHTIHRLISSTLDIDELLPRIARLCLQVMQANRCSIKLLDKERGVLTPVTTIDLRAKRKLYPKELKVGKGVPGKAVKSEKVLRSSNFLSIPLIDQEETIGVITIYDKVNRRSFTQFDQEIMMTIAEQAVIAIKNAQLYREQESLALSGIKSLATLLDTSGPAAFIPRTSFVSIAVEVGKELDLNKTELRSLQCAALLHDAGQIFVPNEILSKPSKLTVREYKLIKEQPTKGAKMLEVTRYLKPVIPIILHHHENYDGTGYPSKLKGNQIPLGARIMAVVSAFMAMITPRAYRITKTIKEANQEIQRNIGTQFDPRVVAAFLKIIERDDIRKIIEGEYAHEPEQSPKGSDIF
ncbi:MAG: GAF domain-containing protein, partial [Candidatus Omnitrophica bacterium]|nr:GAF domain-containing protein [Candidatus Omnitrophota bacterium]